MVEGDNPHKNDFEILETDNYDFQMESFLEKFGNLDFNELYQSNYFDTEINQTAVPHSQVFHSKKFEEHKEFDDVTSYNE